MAFRVLIHPSIKERHILTASSIAQGEAKTTLGAIFQYRHFTITNSQRHQGTCRNLCHRMPQNQFCRRLCKCEPCPTGITSLIEFKFLLHSYALDCVSAMLFHPYGTKSIEPGPHRELVGLMSYHDARKSMIPILAFNKEPKLIFLQP